MAGGEAVNKNPYRAWEDPAPVKEDRSQALETAVFAGSILLKSGAEVFRVEQTIRMIAQAFGAQDYETFIMSTGLITTAGGPRQKYFAKVMHIPFGDTRLDKVEAVNQVSRQIVAGRYTMKEAWEKLEEIDRMPRKRPWACVLASGVGCGGSCLTFGGQWLDVAAAFLAGIVLYLYILGVEGKGLSKITRTIGGGAVATLISLLFWRAGLGERLHFIIGGAIMPLVPGVAFVTSIRDMAFGDYIAGSIRMIDTLLTLFCIAAGVGGVISLWRLLVGGVGLWVL